MNAALVMFKDGQRRDFPIPGEKVVIGRRPDCGIRIPVADVSRQHCEIASGSGGLMVKDLGSSNGTFVNGKRIAESRLMPGDRLGVGPIIFMVQVNGFPAKITPFDLKPPPMVAADDDDDTVPPAKPGGAGGKPAPAAAGKTAGPGDKKKLGVPGLDDDDDDEEVVDLDDFDIESMFDDDEDDDDPKSKKKK